MKAISTVATVLIVLGSAITSSATRLHSTNVGGYQKCVYAPPQTGLKYTDYAGVWYEIGRIQTPGGAFFQKDCVCTTQNVTFASSSSSNATVDNGCRITNPADGLPLNFDSHLTQMRLPGQWINTFPFNPSYHVNYTIIEHGADASTGEEYSVEYDCGSNWLAGTNYCIHILARKPTISETLRKKLLAKAEGYGINTLNLPFIFTNQSSTCKYL